MDLSQITPEDPLFYPTVHDVVKRIIRIPFDTEDVVMDIWIYLHERPHLQLSAGMIKFLCLKALRKKRKDTARDDKYIPPTDSSSKDHLKIDVGDLIQTAPLAPLQRRIIFLRYHMNYTYDQISTSLNIARWRVKALHQKAIYCLQQETRHE